MTRMKTESLSPKLPIWALFVVLVASVVVIGTHLVLLAEDSINDATHDYTNRITKSDFCVYGVTGNSKWTFETNGGVLQAENNRRVHYLIDPGAKLRFVVDGMDVEIQRPEKADLVCSNLVRFVERMEDNERPH